MKPDPNGRREVGAGAVGPGPSSWSGRACILHAPVVRASFLPLTSQCLLASGGPKFCESPAAPLIFVPASLDQHFLVLLFCPLQEQLPSALAVLQLIRAGEGKFPALTQFGTTVHYMWNFLRTRTQPSLDLAFY